MSDWVPTDFVTRDGVRLAVYSDGPENGPPVLMVHGWPELAYSWSPIMPKLAAAGYQCFALDLRGFGESSVPKAVSAYHITEMVADIEAVIDYIGAAKLPIIAHDWGGIILWHAARMITSRISHCISISTPHVRPAPADPIEIFRKRHGDGHYFVHFKDKPGVADALFARDPDAFFQMMFRTTPPDAVMRSEFSHIPDNFEAFLARGAPELPGQILTEEQRAVFVDAYTRAGFSGGINLYRNTTANWEFGQSLPDRITQPSLMISPQNDLFLPPEFAAVMEGRVRDLTRVVLPDCGHWAMWEQPEALSEIILHWMDGQGV